MATRKYTSNAERQRAYRERNRTTQGYNLKAMVKRRDPRLQQFLEDCKYLT